MSSHCLHVSAACDHQVEPWLPLVPFPSHSSSPLMIIIGLVYMELTYHLLQTNQHTSTPTLYSWSCLIGTLQWSIRQIAVNSLMMVCNLIMKEQISSPNSTLKLLRRCQVKSPRHCADAHYTAHIQRISSNYATFNKPECIPDATT